MPLSSTEKEWFEGFLEHYDGREKDVSEWAQGFITDQKERFEKYGADMRLSPKQWAVLQRAAGDIQYDGPSGQTTYDGPSDDEIPF